MIRRLIIILLVMTVLVPAVPIFNTCDANRNSRIDLGDVIANMRSLVQSADEPRDFRGELEKAVTSIRNVAGLNQIIATDETSTKAVGGANHVFLVSSIDVAPVLAAMSVIGDSPEPYQSIESPAVHGPPEEIA